GGGSAVHPDRGPAAGQVDRRAVRARRPLHDTARATAVDAGPRRSGTAALNAPGDEPPDAERPLGAVRGIIGLSRRPSRKEWRRALIAFCLGAGALLLVVLLVHPQPPLLATGASAPAIVLRDGSGG